MIHPMIPANSRLLGLSVPLRISDWSICLSPLVSLHGWPGFLVDCVFLCLSSCWKRCFKT